TPEHREVVGREARRIAAEVLRCDGATKGEELVARFAQQLSALETARGRPAQRIAEVMVERLERKEDLQRHPEKLAASILPTGFRSLMA
ncbi:MAG: hypothetical protein IPL34_20570, partial [Thiofilum sp.]|uniref:hypothetical protein n=1 Tax=Thiofilum sp. TaxID=2212733 RepID=UPI0025D14FAD